MTQALNHLQHAGIIRLTSNIIDEMTGLPFTEITTGVGNYHAIILERKQIHCA